MLRSCAYVAEGGLVSLVDALRAARPANARLRSGRSARAHREIEAQREGLRRIIVSTIGCLLPIDNGLFGRADLLLGTGECCEGPFGTP